MRTRGAALARASAERYGRAAALVEADRRSAVARILQARAAARQPLQPAEAPPTEARNEHRPRKKKRAQELGANV